MKKPRDSSASVKHVLKTLTNVLRRPRFKFSVEENLVSVFGDSSIFETRLTVSTSFGDKFRVVYREFMSRGDVSVIRLNEGGRAFSSFYHQSFKVGEIPNLRKIAITMANKMNGAPFADVMD